LNYPPANFGDSYIWPDGSEDEWNWDTLAEVSRQLTLDSAGLNPHDQGFDSQNIVQIGFHPLWLSPTHIGTFFAPGRLWVASDGIYTVQIPASWISAWDWWHDGMFGEEPFIPNGALASSPEFGIGNTFNARKTAMILTQTWYTCCLADAGENWDLAALPSYQDFITGRLSVDTFRIWKGTPHPEAAFEVLTYLVSAQAVSHLCLGDEKHPGGAYDSLPALKELQDEYLKKLSFKYPHVDNWDIVYQSIMYPDIPSAESWMPNWQEAWTRIDSFGVMLQNNDDLDLDSEIQVLQSDLETILNK
jgi:multiple sugar transport system substrate-binding protein